MFADDPVQQKVIYETMLKGWDDCCGVEMPFCTYFIGGTRVCHIRVNKGEHLLNHYFKHMHVLGVEQRDIWHFSVGLW